MKRLIFVSLIILVVSAVASVFFLSDKEYRFLAQEMATELAMPAGIVWLGLCVACLSAYGQGNHQTAVLCLLLFVVHGLATNRAMARYLAMTLEREYLADQPLQWEPFDALVLLGGGTNESAAGIPQLNQSGDRLTTVARMYHRGLTKRIYCTGTTNSLTCRTFLSPADQAEEILEDLGVPPESTTVVDGYNTKDEMENLSRHLNPEDKVGLVTSARHLPRALRLARSMGLDLVPIPSDFETQPGTHFGPKDAIPSGKAGLITRDCLKEYMAWWFNR